MKHPILMVMAGPNGSGKSTVTECYDVIGDYVNADEIQKHLGCSSLEAAQIAEATRERLLSEGRNFTFETVASTDRNFNLMQRAKNVGYTVICIYVLTCNPDINIKRVKMRKRNGGHDVPPEKVKTRYYRAMKLIPRLFDVCDECYIYDNSIDRQEGEPSRILDYVNRTITLHPNEVWSKEMLEKLCDGLYEP